jgi:hypothetical protein
MRPHLHAARAHMLRAHAHSLGKAAHHRHAPAAHTYYLDLARRARQALAALVQTPVHAPERRR